jgi:hypothetical protein
VKFQRISPAAVAPGGESNTGEHLREGFPAQRDTSASLIRVAQEVAVENGDTGWNVPPSRTELPFGKRHPRTRHRLWPLSIA